MKKPSRFLRMILAAGLLVGLLSAMVAPAAAQQNAPGDPTQTYPFQNTPPSFAWGTNAIFYPWVSNGENFGLGDSVTSISVQNLEDQDGQIWIFRGNGDNTWTLAQTAALSAYASKTFSASDLGITDGAPVAVRGYTTGVTTAYSGSLIETEVLLFVPAGVENAGDDIYACVVNWHEGGAVTGNPAPFTAAVTFTWDGVVYNQGDAVPWENQAELQAILNAVNAGNAGEMINPFGGLNQDGDCLDITDEVDGVTYFWNSLTIGGTALQTATAAAPGDDDDNGAEMEQFVTTHTAVSGYNALNGAEIARFNEWYLPIVQTNCGPGGCWNSEIRIANMSHLNSGVTARFFPADDGSGSLQTGFQLQANLNGGATWNIDLADYVPEGWVGAVHVYTDGYVFAMVDRYKVGYNMWITNTGSAANFENEAQYSSDAAGGRFALFAPHVLMDYFGWNTGINVANLYDGDNHVTIQYFNMLGNATQVLSQRLAAHGMTYFYDPSVGAQNNSAQDVATDPNAGVVGSAIIWSDFPVAAAIDATKYPETDPRGGVDVFQATSYSATQNVFTWQAVPYVTKGNPTDGSGATSGINMMNPNPTAVTANVYWVNPSGFNAQNTGIGSVTIPGYANGFVYTLWQHNLPNGFTGAAQVVASQPIAAVSANVNYDVDGDGSAIFNAFNPCGFYRTVGACSFGDPFDTTGGSVTKYFVDEWDNPVAGVIMMIEGDNPAFPYTRQGVSNVDGQVTFTNVPVGNYDLNVIDVPAGYVQPMNPADQFTLIEGDDWVETNVLEWDQGFLKTVCVAEGFFFDGENGEGGAIGQSAELQQLVPVLECAENDDDEVVGIAGVNVVVFQNIGEDFLGGQVAGDIVFEGVTGADGTVGAALPPGDYILCIYQEDFVGYIANGDGLGDTAQEVDLVIQDQVYATALCAGELFDVIEWELWGDLFTVEAGEVTELENPVFLSDGVMDVFVGAQVGEFDEFVGVSDILVCLDDDTGTDIGCVYTVDGWASFYVGNGDFGTVYLFDDVLQINNAEIDDVIDCFGQAYDGGFGNNNGGSEDGYCFYDYSAEIDIIQDGIMQDAGGAPLDADLIFQITLEDD